MSRKGLWKFILLLIVVSANGVFAEILVMKNGDLIDGQIRYEDEQVLAVDVNGELRLIQKSEVSQILNDKPESESPSPSQTNGDALAGGDTTDSDESSLFEAPATSRKSALEFRLGAWFGPETGDLESRLGQDILLSGTPAFSTEWSGGNMLAIPVGFSYVTPFGAGDLEVGLDLAVTTAEYENNVFSPFGLGFASQEIQYMRVRGDLFTGYRISASDGKLIVTPKAGISYFIQDIDREATGFSSVQYSIDSQSRSANAMGLGFGLELEFRVQQDIGLFVDHWRVPETSGTTSASFNIAAVGFTAPATAAISIGDISSGFRWSAERTTLGVRYYPTEAWQISAGWRQASQRTTYPGYLELGFTAATDGSTAILFDVFELLTDSAIYGRADESKKGQIFFEATYALDI